MDPLHVALEPDQYKPDPETGYSMYWHFPGVTVNFHHPVFGDSMAYVLRGAEMKSGRLGPADVAEEKLRKIANDAIFGSEYDPRLAGFSLLREIVFREGGRDALDCPRSLRLIVTTGLVLNGLEAESDLESLVVCALNSMEDHRDEKSQRAEAQRGLELFRKVYGEEPVITIRDWREPVYETVFENAH